MKNKCDCYHEQAKTLCTYHPVTGQPFAHHIYVGVCWGTRERDECKCGGCEVKCDFYPEVRTKAKKVAIEDAVQHYEHGVDHDIFSEPVTTYANLSIEALNKQIPKKPVHIHEEHSEHLWARDANGKIDLWAFESGFHNGPYCTRCHHSECEHCNPDWENNPEEPCVVDRDICPTCGKEIDYWHRGNYCHECGQKLDWSE
jgi:hypothetical protein